MGKGKGKGPPRQQGRGPKNPSKIPARDKLLPKDDDDLDDDIDAFHKQRDVIPLNVNDDAVDSDDDMEQPVFDFEDREEESNDDDEEDDEEDDDDIEDDIQPNSFAAKIARQAKFLKLKFGGDDDEMRDNDNEPEEERKAVWGRSKNLYYSADNVDYELQSSDEDLPMEEEAEVVKIQRENAQSLTLEDFGLEDVDKDESDTDVHERTIEDALARKTREKPKTGYAVEDIAFEGYEEINKDFASLSKEEQMDLVYNSAPELVGLLSELDDTLKQLQKLRPLLCELKESNDAGKCRMRYLEVKQMLLLTYCQAIAYYLLLKSEGQPVRDHPVIARLVEIKNLMEKMKQIDINLPLQIEEKENANQNYVSGTRDKLGEGSIPLELEQEITNVSAKAREDSVNETAELATVEFSKDNHSKHVDQKNQDVQMSLHSKEMLKIRANLEAKLKQKGINNLTNAKPERNGCHAMKPINGRLETRYDFDDDVRWTSNDSHLDFLHPSKLSCLVSNKAKKLKMVSGDDDLPKRDDIGERRRKHELRVLARVGAEAVEDDVEDEGIQTKTMDVDCPGEDEALDAEDDFYKEAKKRRTEKLMAKGELYSRVPTIPASMETEVDGKRLITYQMEKNRGLTRSRKKLTKIPRKKYKIKHQKAVIRRKGQVRDIKKPTGPYGGEATGININVSRSIRLK